MSPRAVAVVGVNRRDLRGQNSGVTLLDRLRTNPRTKRVVDRLAGSTRVSRIWIKTASDHQGLLIVTAGTMFAMMGVMIGPMYSLIDDRLIDFADVFPDTLLALFGGGDMSTAEGWYQLETFGLMAPIAVMVVTVAIAARALAGEETRRTMGLLLANPIPRSRVVLEKSIAMAIYGFVVGFATFAGVAIGSALGGLGMSPGNIAATSLLVSLLGIAFGAFALAVGAATVVTRERESLALRDTGRVVRHCDLGDFNVESPIQVTADQHIDDRHAQQDNPDDTAQAIIAMAGGLVSRLIVA